MTQELHRDGLELTTTRSPIRIDGERLTNSRPAPRLGEHDPVEPHSVEEIA